MALSIAHFKARVLHSLPPAQAPDGHPLRSGRPSAAKSCPYQGRQELSLIEATSWKEPVLSASEKPISSINYVRRIESSSEATVESHRMLSPNQLLQSNLLLSQGKQTFPCIDSLVSDAFSSLICAVECCANQLRVQYSKT